MIIGISGKIGSGKDTVAKMIQYLIVKQKFDIDLDTTSFTYATETGELYTDVAFESGFKVKRFADKLKDIVCLLINCTREQLEDREFKEKPLGEEWWYYKSGNIISLLGSYTGVDKKIADSRFLVKTTPRLLLQLLGTECGREIIHPNVWVNTLFADYIPEDRGMIAGKNYPESKWIIPDVRFPNELQRIQSVKGLTIRISRDTITPPIQHKGETALDNCQDFDYFIKNDGTLEDLLFKVKDILQFVGIISGGQLVQS